MKTKLTILGLAFLGASCLFAQEPNSFMPTLGFKVGVPVTDMFSAGNTSEFNDGLPGSAYNVSVPRYKFGVSAEFHLPYHLRLEVDGLFQRAAFATQDSLVSLGGGDATHYYSTKMNVFEVPAVLKYNIAMGHFRPFIDFGASLRHIAGIDNVSSYSDLPLFYYNNNTPELMNRNSFGGVAGIGMTFKKGPFELTPEVRYTRWSNESFSAAGLRTNLDQGDVLLGIGF